MESSKTGLSDSPNMSDFSNFSSFSNFSAAATHRSRDASPGVSQGVLASVASVRRMSASHVSVTCVCVVYACVCTRTRMHACGCVGVDVFGGRSFRLILNKNSIQQHFYF